MLVLDMLSETPSWKDFIPKSACMDNSKQADRDM